MSKIKNKLHNVIDNKWFLFTMCVLLGQFGIHRFLMRRWTTGVLLFICSLFGLGSAWSMIDAVLIALNKLTPRPRRITSKRPKQRKTATVKKETPMDYNGPMLISDSGKVVM